MRAAAREVRRVKAISLRLAGYSRAQIAQALGVKSGGQALDRWLQGIPAPEWTNRPRAMDDLKARAIELRRKGRSYAQIQAALGVSRSSLSVWLRDVPISEEYARALAERQRIGRLKGSAARRARAASREKMLVAEASARVGEVSERELFVAGVVAYWAEGRKTKPWGPRADVSFVNSEPNMIRLFLRWLELIGVSKDEVAFRVSIHESADLDRAIHFWSAIVGVSPNRFLKTTLKRHNPRTTRKNVGAEYQGCLSIVVRRSTDLNSRIRGWFQGIVEAITEVR